MNKRNKIKLETLNEEDKVSMLNNGCSEGDKFLILTSLLPNLYKWTPKGWITK